jgi:hypothetical protein
VCVSLPGIYKNMKIAKTVAAVATRRHVGSCKRVTRVFFFFEIIGELGPLLRGHNYQYESIGQWQYLYSITNE